MALLKPFKTNFGVDVNYHKLLKVELDSVKQELVMTVAVYVSPEAKEAGAVPIWHEYVTIPFSEMQWDPREAFYPLLKTYIQSYLSNSEDVLPAETTVKPPVFELIDVATVKDPDSVVTIEMPPFTG